MGSSVDFLDPHSVDQESDEPSGKTPLPRNPSNDRSGRVRKGGFMAQQLKMGAMMACSFGAAPASLIVLPVNRTNAESAPAANIMDFKPIVNIPPFGMC